MFWWRRLGFFGQDVEAGEEAEGVIEVEVVDMAVTFLVEEFQDQEAEQGVDGGKHFGDGILGVLDKVVEAELGQEGQEQEDAGEAGAERTSRVQREHTAIGDGRRFGTGRGVAALVGTSPQSRNEKGGTIPFWN